MQLVAKYLNLNSVTTTKYVTNEIVHLLCDLLSLQLKVPSSRFTVATGKAKFQLKLLFSFPKAFSF